MRKLVSATEDGRHRSAPRCGESRCTRRVAALGILALLATGACGIHTSDVVPASEGHSSAAALRAGSEPGHCPPASPGRYVHAADPSFRWSTVSERRTGDGTIFDLRLISQHWQGNTWEHHLLLFVPAAPLFPDTALLVLREGLPGDGDAGALETTSNATGTSAALFYGVPNQPLLGGLEEDALLAHTFSEYLRTGDDSWPLLFPMVKSVVRSIDTIQTLTADSSPIDRFIVAGHSKRGHTAWLSAAADQRIKGIIPLAINVLNSPAQIAHHQEVTGGIGGSSSVFEETIQGADTPRGRCLIEMIDAYTYRDRLAAPKLIVLGTNDDYTPTDALNLYWPGLPGAKSVLYLANTSHAGVDRHSDVNPTAFAFVRAVASGTSMPAITSEIEAADGTATFRVTANPAPVAARVWTSTSHNRDFRTSRWGQAVMRTDSRTMPAVGATFRADLPLLSSGSTAAFGELEFEIESRRFTLSTQMHILPAEPVRQPSR